MVTDGKLLPNIPHAILKIANRWADHPCGSVLLGDGPAGLYCSMDHAV